MNLDVVVREPSSTYNVQKENVHVVCELDDMDDDLHISALFNEIDIDICPSKLQVPLPPLFLLTSVEGYNKEVFSTGKKKTISKLLLKTHEITTSIWSSTSKEN